MTRQTDTPANQNDNKLPIYLSAFAFPGAGQFIQHRWMPAILYSISFFICFYLICARVIELWIGMIRSATDDKPFDKTSLSQLAWPLVFSILIYLLGVMDTTIAYGKTRRLVAQRKLDSALKQISAIILISFSCFIMDSKAQSEEMFLAIKSNDVSRIDKIIKRSGLSAVRNASFDGVTPLHLAAALNRYGPAASLLRAGADINALSTTGFTALHWAASKDSVETAKLLIKVGANVNVRAIGGVTPLHWAARNNATNIITLLIAAGADMEARTETGATPIHWATQAKAIESVRLLASRMASDQVDAENKTVIPADLSETAAKPAVIKDPAVDLLIPLQQKTNTNLTAKTLTVSIGPAEALYFVWIEPLKLWVSKYETTNAQFKNFKPGHNSMSRETFKLNTPDQPVVYVSWNEARDFCKWLNKNCAGSLPEDSEFRLPTDREWISVARCGTSRVYPWGNEWPPKYGNFSCLTARKELSDWSGIRGYDDGYAVSCPVIASGSNEWGIYGLAGNVWEWCEDWFDNTKKYKIRHGGSWDFDDKKSISIDYRGFDRPETRDDTIGFRVIISQKDSTPPERSLLK